MTLRCSDLPLLPGFCFNRNIGQRRFHKSQHFTRCNEIPMLANKPKPAIGGTLNRKEMQCPSIYARGEAMELPAWIMFDKKVLRFDAFFQETLQECRSAPFQIRRCIIYFFLEDGTIKVTEPKVPNSGIPQGTLISRQRIRLPKPKDDIFYDIIDFNIGKEIELYGKVFKITNCDNFTRIFLNRSGIAVSDSITQPDDPYFIERDKMLDALLPRKLNHKVDTFGQFLAYDRHVLCFYGYWDDRATEGGTFHNLEIHYFLSDDTIEIREITAKSGKNTGFMFIKRAKLPKFCTGLSTPGCDDSSTVLNVLGAGLQGGRYIYDPLNCGTAPIQYYKQNDLAIGAAINCYGRKIMLTDCNSYTKEYYRSKYGLDDFSPQPKPDVEEKIGMPIQKRVLPPWNGFGTFEDSAQNCVTVELKSINRQFKKFLALDRDGLDSRTLRFAARMLSKIPEHADRKFVICYYLADNTISVHEFSTKHSGSAFLIRGPVKLPGQNIYTSEPPDYYEPQHMFVGAQIHLNSFIFILIDADEYALRYMELHCNEFPKSNINVILNKVREKLRPIYKQFVAENLPKEQPVLQYEDLRYKLCKIMGEDWSEHEMITLARHFSAVCKTEKYSRDYIRSLILTELKKSLWDDLDRFKEYFYKHDPQRIGYLPRKVVYSLIQGCRLRLNKELIEHMLNVINKNDNCDLEYKDLFYFLDRNNCALPDALPINIKYDDGQKPLTGALIDWCAFNKSLGLEEIVKDEN